ncbi:MAG: tRNA pseudouridine(55) synthase TruB [Alphaproteobacteria bacterium]|nr:tRNA pseudouridine(55) synthase TruB [Alphaproteobacteria bacterium]
MARKRKGDKINGWVNLDKPVGLTSTQAMAKVRRIMNAQKAGHAGTLDPLATGILPIALGEATKTIMYVQDKLKTYSFTITWGEQRDTDDSEGDIIKTSDIRPSNDEIKNALLKYTGHIKQIPPKFSAIKIDGKRAYDLARKGENVELKPREVYIDNITLTQCRENEADLIMTCGKGTYVRSLARDLAKDLNTVGYISSLHRKKVGSFTDENSIFLDKLEEMSNIAALEAILPLETVLDDIPALAIKEDEMALLMNGQMLTFISKPDFQRLVDIELGDKNIQEALAVCKGKPIALIDVQGAQIKPVRVFNL